MITCGDEGSVLSARSATLAGRDLRVPYQGGTGSGDAFDAGFIAGMLAGAEVDECLRWASAIGASCVRSISATDSVFTRAEAEQFMRENSLAVDAAVKRVRLCRSLHLCHIRLTVDRLVQIIKVPIQES